MWPYCGIQNFHKEYISDEKQILNFRLWEKILFSSMWREIKSLIPSKFPLCVSWAKKMTKSF